jgi:hypothetical protein
MCGGIRCDPGRLRAGGGEGMHVIAPQHTRQASEGLRDDAEIGRSRRPRRVERPLVVPRPGRHHERALWPERIAKRQDQPNRPTLDRPHGPKRAVHEQNPALLHPEGAELPDEVGPARRLPRSLRHARPPDRPGAPLAPHPAARYSTALRRARKRTMELVADATDRMTGATNALLAALCLACLLHLLSTWCRWWRWSCPHRGSIRTRASAPHHHMSHTRFRDS